MPALAKDLLSAAIVVLLCLSAGCQDATGSDTRPVGTIAIAGDSSGLAVGGTRQLTALPLGLDGDTLRDRGVVWSSSDSTVAAVSAEGLVTARAVGSVTIRATIDGQTGEADLAVIPQGYSGKWSSVSASTARSCALTEGGVAYCWGERLVPQQGTDSVGVPTRVPGPQTFVQVSTAVSFGATPTCGLASDGAAYCWGGNLGGTPDGKPGRVSVPSLTTLVADAELACGLAAGGEAYCWGPGLLVVLLSYDHSPVPVLPGVRLTSLAIGRGMVCGIDTVGATVCGHQHSIHRSTPPPYADGFTSVVVGSEFRCGLHSDGQALCSTVAGHGVGGSWGMASELTPVLAPHPLVKLSAGGYQACGLTANGTAYCWTVSVSQSYSEPGSVTAAAAVGGAPPFVQISVAATHACGITADGEIYCWGDNAAGELGNGTVGGSTDAPLRVSDPA